VENGQHRKENKGEKEKKRKANEDADGVDATRRNMAGKLQNSRENKIKKHSHIFQFGAGQSSKATTSPRGCCSCDVAAVPVMLLL